MQSAKHSLSYETKIPTMRTVKWIAILIANHQWNYEAKHANYENSTMNNNRDNKIPVKL